MTATQLERDREFWNQAARDNPYWYVSTFGPYEGRNLDEFWKSGEKIWKDLQQALDFSPTGKEVVVEIGCGVGRLTRVFAREVASVYAFDVSDEMLRRASASAAPNVTFHRTEGVSLQPVGDGSADLVLSYLVFHHLPSEAALADYLREMVRVAKPNGIIAFTLSPRNWKANLKLLAKLRRWMHEQVKRGGPRGLYRDEWLGIAPRARTVKRLSPVPLEHAMLHGDKWLFFGRR